MVCTVLKDGLLGVALAVGFLAGLPWGVANAHDDAKDWPMYNCDVIGTRHNKSETAIDKSNAGRLEEKWRFPPKGSELEIGVIHATPIVVDGCVYFGTATDPTFYKLAPGGKLKWSYRNPARPHPQGEGAQRARFQTSPDGILGSALVALDTVFFGDIGGWFYALDRVTGKERWKLNARAKEFPGAHELNCFFGSTIRAATTTKICS